MPYVEVLEGSVVPMLYVDLKWVLGHNPLGNGGYMSGSGGRGYVLSPSFLYNIIFVSKNRCLSCRF